MITRVLIVLIVLSSCNCDEYYNRDEKIKGKLNDFKDAYNLISKNYEFLKSNGLSLKSASPQLEGISMNYEKITQLSDKQNNQALISIKRLWDKHLIDKSGEIEYSLMDNSPAIEFNVKRCRRIEHIIYFGENDMFDNRGQSDDFSIFALDSLEGHWRYIIQQVNN